MNQLCQSTMAVDEVNHQGDERQKIDQIDETSDKIACACDIATSRKDDGNANAKNTSDDDDDDDDKLAFTPPVVSKVASTLSIDKNKDKNNDQDPLSLSLPRTMHTYSQESVSVSRANRNLALSQTQGIIHSQTPSQTSCLELTQTGDCCSIDFTLSPMMQSQSPTYQASYLQALPWARLVPCSPHHNNTAAANLPLLPRPPKIFEKAAGNDPNANANSNAISLMGLRNLRIGDSFNEYILGRGPACDIVATKPEPSEALQEWAHGLISHSHCRIYTCLEPELIHRQPGQYNVQVYLQDHSVNGTVVNKTTVLTKGQSRLLYSGDEICLVNPNLLRKKIRSQRALQPLLQQYSYIFINLLHQHQQLPPAIPTTLGAAIPSSIFPVPASRRKPAVNVRATRQHRPTGPSTSPYYRPPPAKRQHPYSFAQKFTPLRRIEDEYDIRQVLGTGTVGEVRRAIHRKSGQERAVKIIKRQLGPFDVMSNSIEAEATILKELKHPYVVKLIDFFVMPTVVYLVMELLHGGDLYYRIVQKGHYTEVDSRRVMRRILSALHYLHEERQIVHRDLKPENLLLASHDSDVDIKLTDFGLAKSVNGESLKTFCGTPLYIPPEVSQRRNTIMGKGRYGKPADMWSLGVILYVLLSGCPPFEVGPGLLDIDIALEWVVEFPEAEWSGISQEAKNLVRALLAPDPNKRLTVRQACQHDWILVKDDGDTHVHPLDDPNVTVLQKRLFPKVMASSSTPLLETAHSQSSCHAALQIESSKKNQEQLSSKTTTHEKNLLSPSNDDQSTVTEVAGDSSHKSNRLKCIDLADARISSDCGSANEAPATATNDRSNYQSLQSSSMRLACQNASPSTSTNDAPCSDPCSTAFIESACESALGCDRQNDVTLHSMSDAEAPIDLPIQSGTTDEYPLLTEKDSKLLTTPLKTTVEKDGAFVSLGSKDPRNNVSSKELVAMELARQPLTHVSSNVTRLDADTPSVQPCDIAEHPRIKSARSKAVLKPSNPAPRKSNRSRRQMMEKAKRTQDITEAKDNQTEYVKTVELSDDEIISQFSDATESVSSFPASPSNLQIDDNKICDAKRIDGSTKDTHGCDILQANAEKNEEKRSKVGKRKRRITDSPRFHSKVKPADPSGNEQCAKKDAKGEKHKQTTLLSWVKRK